MRFQKKSVMGEIISVFVMVLVVSILAGLSFLFVSALKTQAIVTADKTTVTVLNESVTFDALNTPKLLSASTKVGVYCNPLTLNVTNATNVGVPILVGNYTQNSATNCQLLNATKILGFQGSNVWNASNTQFVSYTYTYVADNNTGYGAINATESAGYTVVGYLPLIFLAVIFGAILVLVLKIILPFINLGKQVGGF